MHSDYVDDEVILEGELMEVSKPKVQSTEPADILKFTQNLRYQIVDDLLGPEKRIPADIRDLASIMRDMDQAALTTRKLDIEESDATDGRLAIDTFRRLKQMIATDRDESKPAIRTRDPLGNVLLPDVSFIPGEDAQGENILNISNYVSAEE